ncbi:FAD-binding protein [Candidatus Bathyarchaeota archaeon]|nr:FAD-binding protein [Candidatus Bathyarchaeota archaeon]
MNASSDIIDVAIVGAGLSGLMAARECAKAGLRTVIFEKNPRVGMLHHPCGCMMSPVDGFITFRETREGAWFEQAGIMIPDDMIIDHPKNMYFMTPTGCRFGMQITKGEKASLVFQVDKQAMLDLLKREAVASGAIIKTGCRISGLLRENGEIVGVISPTRGSFPSRLVIDASGLSRKLSQDAGLFEDLPTGYLTMVARTLKGIAIPEHLRGQAAVFFPGGSELPSLAIIFHSMGENDGMLLLTVRHETPEWPAHLPSIVTLLESTILKVNWMRQMVRKGKTVGLQACRMVLQRPSRLIIGNFIGTGDAIAPLGHSSIAIAMLLGRSAGTTAIEMLQAKDVRSRSKASNRYTGWIESKIFQGVEFEANMITGIMDLDKGELERLCRTFSGINLGAFFIGSRWQRARIILRMLFSLKVWRNFKLIRRVFSFS